MVTHGMSDPWTPVDPLGEALHFLRMSGTFYCRSEFTAPWGLELPPMPGCLMFHVVTSGRCWLEVEGAEPRLLQPGDLALVPHGEGHRPGERARCRRPRGCSISRASTSASATRSSATAAAARRRVWSAAPSASITRPRTTSSTSCRALITVEAWSSPEMEWIQSTLRFMAAEAKELRPGGETVITRLADILVIQAIRSWIEQDPAAQTGWLGALQDQQIGRAIALIHRDPARAWTVASLAAEVAMSRSAFAARFTELVGEPPMHYVARWRMHVALTWLKEDGADPRRARDPPRLPVRGGLQPGLQALHRRLAGRGPADRRRGERPEDRGDLVSAVSIAGNGIPGLPQMIGRWMHAMQYLAAIL